MDTSNIERRRLAAVHRLEILDSPPDERFERLTRVARQYYGTAFSVFSIVDENRLWFKSKQGISLSEMPRSFAICEHAIRQDKVFIIQDASLDRRFRDNPMVTGAPHIRFFAGVPVREPSGFKVGTLAILDTKPRIIRESELDILRSLASIVEDELERSLLASDTSKFIHVSGLTRAIHRAQNAFLTSDDQRVVFELMLNDLLTLTGSQFGLIGEVQHQSDGRPYLKIGALTNIAWNPETQALYQNVEDRGLTFERLDNLLGRPMVTGEVLIANDVEQDPRRGGTPAGHPVITSYIGIPVFSGDKQIGLIGLANRAGGYGPDLAVELEPLLQTVGTLIDRKRLYQEKQEHQKSLEHAANYDELTGLPNRRRLTELFEQELAAADLREGSVSVCFIDLDGFKEINDAHGHNMGDVVLKLVAERLKSALRPHDVIARLGGDEFVAILRDVSDHQVYTRMLEAISQPFSYKQLILNISGSMGVTIYPDDFADTDLLLRHADQAMYAAKESGKNQFKLFDIQTHLTRKKRVKVLEQIEEAIRKQQFELYYQPKINLMARKVEGFEALIRWNHPEEGLLGPESFLDYLEHTEYARRVSHFVLQEAVGKLCELHIKGLEFTVSINLSPSHFLSHTFRHDLSAVLEHTCAPVRERLILELLETTTLDDSDKVIENLVACRNLGVGISLDDFGTGYSSLDYFRRLPAQEIKIDRSFVRDMLRDPDDEMIVTAIIGLSKSFRRQVVAEGIEDMATQNRLITLGCDLGQGFYYSPPRPFDEALAWARNFQFDRHAGLAPPAPPTHREHCSPDV